MQTPDRPVEDSRDTIILRENSELQDQPSVVSKQTRSNLEIQIPPSESKYDE